MMKSKLKKMPHFKSVSDLVNFVERNDLGDYLEQLPEVHFNVNIKRKFHLFALDAKLATKLNQIAKSKKTSSEKLINSWIREKVHKLSS